MQDSTSKRLCEFYRSSCGIFAFNTPHLFPGNDAFTLGPITELGRDCLACAGIAGMRSAALVHLKIESGNERNSVVTYSSTDVFTDLEEHGVDLSCMAIPASATFAITLNDDSTRKIVLRPPNILRCQRDGDDLIVRPWLSSHGFVKEPCLAGPDDAAF